MEKSKKTQQKQCQQAYDLIYDESQIKKFHELFINRFEKDNIYFLTLIARSKYSDFSCNMQNYFMSNHRKIITNADFEQFLMKIKHFCIPDGAYRTKNNQQITKSSLVIYCEINPKGTLKAFNKLKTFADTYLREAMTQPQRYDNFRKIVKNLKGYIHGSDQKKLFVTVDVDDKKFYKQTMQILKEQEIDIYCIIETRGGFHMILENEKLSQEKYGILKKTLKKEFTVDKKEMVEFKSMMAPVPGTYQGGFPCRLIYYKGMKGHILPSSEEQMLEQITPQKRVCYSLISDLSQIEQFHKLFFTQFEKDQVFIMKLSVDNVYSKENLEKFNNLHCRIIRNGDCQKYIQAIVELQIPKDSLLDSQGNSISQEVLSVSSFLNPRETVVPFFKVKQQIDQQLLNIALSDQINDEAFTKFKVVHQQLIENILQMKSNKRCIILTIKDQEIYENVFKELLIRKINVHCVIKGQFLYYIVIKDLDQSKEKNYFVYVELKKMFKNEISFKIKECPIAGTFQNGFPVKIIYQQQSESNE